MTRWQRLWHRLTGCRFLTDKLSEECAACGTPQGDWVFFGGPLHEDHDSTEAAE
jgi:hypothetical protein